MKNNPLLSMTQAALITALIAVFAQIALPVFAVPMTLQTFAVCLAGFLLGKYYGMVSVIVYLALGAVGLPVFSGFQGSLGVLAGPTGGFLIGFLPLVFLCGFSAKKRHDRSQANKLFFLLFPFLGLFICHLLGVLWFSHTMGNSLFTSFLLSSAPYLIKDMLSCLFAKLLANRLFRYL